MRDIGKVRSGEIPIDHVQDLQSYAADCDFLPVEPVRLLRMPVPRFCKYILSVLPVSPTR